MLKVKQTFLIVTLVLSLCGSFFIAGSVVSADCAGVETSIIDCEQSSKATCPTGTTYVEGTKKCSDGSEPVVAIEETGVWGILMLAINILTGAIAVAALGGIAYAAVMYASAGGNVDKTKKAIEIIMNVVTGAVLYAIAWALLSWLIPGGAF